MNPTSSPPSTSPARRGRTARGAGTGALAALLVAALAVATPTAAHALDQTASSPETTTVLVTSTAGTTWTVPAGVTELSVQMAGGVGASVVREHQETPAGRADELRFDLGVTGGDSLRLYGSTRGGISKNHNAGRGYLNGGGGGDRAGGATRGGGGGGASAVLLNDTLVAVAGGGGGAGGASNVGSTLREPHPWRFGGGGGWAGVQADDVNGDDGVYGSHPGKGGTAAKATGKSATNGSDAASFTAAAGGGGGGGGWPSGNGGQSGKGFSSFSTGGGGAGGTSYTAASVKNLDRRTRVEGDGMVQITYRNPVRISLSAPASFPAIVPQNATIAITGANGAAVKPGTITLWAGSMFLGLTKTWDGYDEMRFTLPAGNHTLRAEFTSDDRSQRVFTTLDVTANLGAEPGVGAAPSMLLFNSVPERVQTGGSVTFSGHLHADGATLTGGETVDVSFAGSTVTVPVDASGAFEASFTAPSTPGTNTLTASFAGSARIAASSSADIVVDSYDEEALVTLGLSSTTLVYGEPVTATAAVSPGDGAGAPATGLVLLWGGTDFIAMAALDGTGTAVFDDLIVPVAASELTASYAGDTVYEGAVSEPVGVSVAAASTQTRLTAESASGRAGDEVSLVIEVAAESRSTLEPAGHVEVILDDEIVATAAPADDVDGQTRDGVSRYELSVSGLPAGTHRFLARFVPGDGFVASESDEQSVTLTAVDTLLRVSPSDILIATDGTAAVQAHVETVGGPLTRLPAPVLEGTVQITRADEPVGDAVAVDSATGTAELRIGGLTVGTHTLDVTFYPDTAAFATSSASLTVEVVAASDTPDPAGGGDAGGDDAADTAAAKALAKTGFDAGGWLLPGALGLLLLGIGGALFARRRKHG